MKNDSDGLKWILSKHKDACVTGRTRLQKTVKVLQTLGFPTNYQFDIFHYGPYSEGITDDTLFLELLGDVEEKEHFSAKSGRQYYKITAKNAESENFLSDPSDCKKFTNYISILEKTDPIPLELGATFLAYLKKRINVIRRTSKRQTSFLGN